MGKLFFHMGVFAVVTFVVYLVCMWFVRFEEKREAKYGRRLRAGRPVRPEPPDTEHTTIRRSGLSAGSLCVPSGARGRSAGAVCAGISGCAAGS